MRTLVVTAQWDPDGRVWWCESDDIPGLVTEADTFDALTERVLAIAPEIIGLNRVAEPGEAINIEIRATRAEHLHVAA